MTPATATRGPLTAEQDFSDSDTAHAPDGPSVAALPRPLVPVERRILLRLARGQTYEQIWDAEGISRTAVGGHVTRIHVLLGVRSSAHAVARAHEYGLLPRDRFARPLVNSDEMILLDMIGAGLPDREIAARLGLTHRVTAHRVRRMYRYMYARNRPHVVHIACCVGLLGEAVADGHAA